jgi:hypothetical protein
VAITVLVKDDNNSAVNIDNLSELHVYISTGGSAVKEFNKAGSGDGQALVKVDTTHYRVDWLSGDTADAAAGQYDIELNVVETDSDYTDSKKNTLLKYPFLDLVATTVKDESS